jgi:hypothetical protein
MISPGLVTRGVAVHWIGGGNAFTGPTFPEQSATRGGLPGPGFYAEDVLFEGGAAPRWITGPKVDWALARYKLAADFIPIAALISANRVANSARKPKIGKARTAPVAAVRASYRTKATVTLGGKAKVA